MPVDIIAFRWSGSMPEWTVGAKVHEGTGHRISYRISGGVDFIGFSGIGRGTKGSGVPPHPPENSFDEARNRLRPRRLLFYSLFRDRLRSLFRASSLLETAISRDARPRDLKGS